MSFLKGTFKFAENFLENVDNRAEQFIQPNTSTLPTTNSANITNFSSSTLNYGGNGSDISNYPNGNLSLLDLQTPSLPSTSSNFLSSTTIVPSTTATNIPDSTSITIHTSNEDKGLNSSSLGTSTAGAQSRLIVYDKDNPQITSLLLEIRNLQQQINNSKKKEIALEEQIKEGFKETERLRTALTEARNQLSEADFDAIYKLRNEYDNLQQKYMILNRDYDTLKLSSEQNNTNIRDTINSSEILVENLQNELMTVRSSSMARKEELVSELAILTQQIITLKQQQSSSSISTNSTVNNETNTNTPTILDNKMTETLASLERELSYERKRYIDCEETNRQLKLSNTKENLQKEEIKRNYDLLLLKNTTLVQQIQDLELQIQKLHTNQESYAVLQRTNTDLAKQLSVQTNEIIDYKTKLKASISLLNQEQQAHNLTRASYDDLQRVVSDLQREKQRLTSASSSSSLSTNSKLYSNPNSNSTNLLRYNNSKYTTNNNTLKFTDFIDRHIGIPITNLIYSSRKARIGIIIYLLCLQFWSFCLMFLHSHSIPHELHKKPI